MTHEEEHVRRDWKGFAVGAGGFVLVTGLILFVFGPSWVGLLATLVLVLSAYVVRMLLPRRQQRALVAGEQTCPYCGSLQTDRVERTAPDGRDLETMHCFACERDFGPTPRLASETE